MGQGRRWCHSTTGTYLEKLLGFLGITDITVVRAEGLSMGDHRATAMSAAQTAIAALG